MSIQLSPDGLYYWDGTRWQSTLSHDGRSRWNGTTWVPSGAASAPAAFGHPARTVREATSWTRPLQVAVAGWYAVSAVYSLTLPLWMSGPMSQAFNQAIQRQQQRNPGSRDQKSVV